MTDSMGVPFEKIPPPPPVGRPARPEPVGGWWVLKVGLRGGPVIPIVLCKENNTIDVQLRLHDIREAIANDGAFTGIDLRGHFQIFAGRNVTSVWIEPAKELPEEPHVPIDLHLLR